MFDDEIIVAKAVAQRFNTRFVMIYVGDDFTKKMEICRKMTALGWTVEFFDQRVIGSW